MGSGYNQEYVTATKDQGQVNLEIASDSNQTDYDIAKLQSDAVVQQAKYDYDARIYEADKNYGIQMEALRVREKEAELQYRVDWKNAQNDAIRAEASMVSAESKLVSAQAKEDKVQYDHQEDMAEQKYGSSQDFWYG